MVGIAEMWSYFPFYTASMNAETRHLGGDHLRPSKEEHTEKVRADLYAEFGRLEQLLADDNALADVVFAAAYEDFETAKKEGHISAEEAADLYTRLEGFDKQLHLEEAA
jgi:hypothetical protein